MKLIKESDTLRANELLKKMSPMEKIGQLHQVWGIDLVPGIPKPDDTADALGLAICYAHSSGSMLGRLTNQR